MTEGRKRGRPRKAAVTLTESDDVELMVIAGMSRPAIAKALGTDLASLEARFGEELADAFDRKHREVLGLLHLAAKKGNVAAQKKLLEITDEKKAAAQLEKPVPVRLQPGKKEQALKEAQTAGTGTKWADFLQETGETDEPLPN